MPGKYGAIDRTMVGKPDGRGAFLNGQLCVFDSGDALQYDRERGTISNLVVEVPLVAVVRSRPISTGGEGSQEYTERPEVTPLLQVNVSPGSTWEEKLILRPSVSNVRIGCVVACGSVASRVTRRIDGEDERLHTRSLGTSHVVPRDLFMVSRALYAILE